MTAYKVFYRGTSTVVHADSPYDAQLLAAIHFKVQKPYHIQLIFKIKTETE